MDLTIVDRLEEALRGGKGLSVKRSLLDLYSQVLEEIVRELPKRAKADGV